MSGDVEREIAWRRQGKGNGLRWHILRDVVAGLSLYGMTLEKTQDYLLMLRGVSWNTCRTMLIQLERLEAVLQDKSPEAFYWSATEKGVTIFLRTRKHIPARIALAVCRTLNVKKDELFLE